MSLLEQFESVALLETEFATNGFWHPYMRDGDLRAFRNANFRNRSRRQRCRLRCWRRMLFVAPRRSCVVCLRRARIRIRRFVYRTRLMADRHTSFAWEGATDELVKPARNVNRLVLHRVCCGGFDWFHLGG
jgi:hypothetical protein